MVRRATYRGREGAAKVLMGVRPSMFASFAKEIKLLSIVKHKHIVEMVGVCAVQREVWLVTELLDAALKEVMEQLRRCPAGLDKGLAKAISFAVAYHHAGDFLL